MSFLINAINGWTRKVSLTFLPSDINSMYASPLLLVPAPGAGLALIASFGILNYIGGSAAFTSGGNIICQYGSTAAGAGAKALSSSTQFASSTTLTSGTVNQAVVQLGLNFSSTSNSSLYLNQGLYLSNITGAFAGGTGATVVVNLEFATVPLS